MKIFAENQVQGKILFIKFHISSDNDAKCQENQRQIFFEVFLPWFSKLPQNKLPKDSRSRCGEAIKNIKDKIIIILSVFWKLYQMTDKLKRIFYLAQHKFPTLNLLWVWELHFFSWCFNNPPNMLFIKSSLCDFLFDIFLALDVITESEKIYY